MFWMRKDQQQIIIPPEDFTRVPFGEAPYRQEVEGLGGRAISSAEVLNVPKEGVSVNLKIPIPLIIPNVEILSIQERYQKTYH